MKFDPVELCKRPRIIDDMDFYLEQFKPTQKLYSEMNQAEQETFKILVRNDFYEWLGLSDAVIESHPSVLQTLSEWLQGQEIVNHLSDAANQVVDAHRDPLNSTLVNLDSEIRNDNQQVIKDLDAKQEDIIGVIREIVRGFNLAADAKAHRDVMRMT